MVWFGETERKISPVINDYLYFPLFLLIILWAECKEADLLKLSGDLLHLLHEDQLGLVVVSVQL
jgi:hypothetical protein